MYRHTNSATPKQWTRSRKTRVHPLMRSPLIGKRLVWCVDQSKAEDEEGNLLKKPITGRDFSSRELHSVHGYPANPVTQDVPFSPLNAAPALPYYPSVAVLQDDSDSLNHCTPLSRRSTAVVFEERQREGSGGEREGKHVPVFLSHRLIVLMPVLHGNTKRE